MMRPAKNNWQEIAQQLASLGYTVNVSSTPHGCCASILSTSKPYIIGRCGNAPTMEAAFVVAHTDLRNQLKED